MLRRMKALGVDQATLVQCWKSEGRVHLEMCLAVWHCSISLQQQKCLQRCQRVAIAAIVGHWMPSRTQQLGEHGLERLSDRRDSICRRFALRTANKSCHKDIFTLAPAGLQRPGKQELKYQEPRARTAAYRKSAVPYLTRLLNNTAS